MHKRCRVPWVMYCRGHAFSDITVRWASHDTLLLFVTITRCIFPLLIS